MAEPSSGGWSLEGYNQGMADQIFQSIRTFSKSITPNKYLMMDSIGTLDDQMERGAADAQADKVKEGQEESPIRIESYISTTSDPSKTALGTHSGTKIPFSIIPSKTDRDIRY